MSSRSSRRTAQHAAELAVARGGGTAGQVAQRAGTALQRAGAAVEDRSTTVAPAVGSAVGTAATSVSGALSDLTASVGGFLEEPAVRGGAALDALRGIPVSPPAARRRWPWALLAAAGGAAAGVAVALLVRRLQPQDPPGAVEPHELRAVVDVPEDVTSNGSAPAPSTSPLPPPA